MGEGAGGREGRAADARAKEERVEGVYSVGCVEVTKGAAVEAGIQASEARVDLVEGAWAAGSKEGGIAEDA